MLILCDDNNFTETYVPIAILLRKVLLQYSNQLTR